jgi:hypothetical protein
MRRTKLAHIVSSLAIPALAFAVAGCGTQQAGPSAAPAGAKAATSSSPATTSIIEDNGPGPSSLDALSSTAAFIAVVQATGHSVQHDGSDVTPPIPYTTTDVKVVKVLKGDLPATLSIYQSGTSVQPVEGSLPHVTDGNQYIIWVRAVGAPGDPQAFRPYGPGLYLFDPATQTAKSLTALAQLPEDTTLTAIEASIGTATASPGGAK